MEWIKVKAALVFLEPTLEEGNMFFESKEFYGLDRPVEKTITSNVQMPRGSLGGQTKTRGIKGNEMCQRKEFYQRSS